MNKLARQIFAMQAVFVVVILALGGWRAGAVACLMLVDSIGIAKATLRRVRVEAAVLPSTRRDEVRSGMITVMTLEHAGDTFTVDWRQRQAVFAELETAMEEGYRDQYIVEIHPMAPVDFDALPEFDGF